MFKAFWTKQKKKEIAQLFQSLTYVPTWNIRKLLSRNIIIHNSTTSWVRQGTTISVKTILLDYILSHKMFEEHNCEIVFFLLKKSKKKVTWYFYLPFLQKEPLKSSRSSAQNMAPSRFFSLMTEFTFSVKLISSSYPTHWSPLYPYGAFTVLSCTTVRPIVQIS